MPISARNRRPPRDPSPSDSDVETTTQGRRRRASTPDDEPEEEDTTMGDVGESQTDGTSQEQMVKKMVRLALACEYARQPIRRVDMGAKVLGQYGRQFKYVFARAQIELREKFGMEMVELPMREKITISQRRAAQRTDKSLTSSKAYVLTSILPEKYRLSEDIVSPPRVPTSETEATYVGLYTFIISIISLCGGTIAEAKLERYLKRTNADQYTPIDKTDKLLQRLCKEGYLVKVKDTSSGEEVVEYMVGPRGKVEIGQDGVTGLVKTVYGEDAMDDLDARIQRSLGVNDPAKKKRRTQVEADEEPEETSIATRRPSRRSGRTAREEDDLESDEEDSAVESGEDA
ncbi:MAG: hypothetical protein M1816_004424 [Peltula sp. TS41687]|nr:MAG: hypothetical protein M1816_004424 [Peltula sp. TS41687]